MRDGQKLPGQTDKLYLETRRLKVPSWTNGQKLPGQTDKRYLQGSFEVLIDGVEKLNVDLLQVVSRTELVQLVVYLDR